MSINPTLVQKMLDADITSASALQKLLTSERELLKNREYEPLSLLITEKNQLLERLNAHADERGAVLNSLGFTPDSSGWQQLLNSDETLSAFTSTWKELQRLIAECKKLNEINGKLMGRSQQSLKRLLDLVRGQSGTPALYNANGNASNAAFSYTVAEA